MPPPFLQDSAQIWTPLGNLPQGSLGRVYGSVHSICCLYAPAWLCDSPGMCSVSLTLSLFLSASQGEITCDMTVFLCQIYLCPPTQLHCAVFQTANNLSILFWILSPDYISWNAIFVGGKRSRGKDKKEKQFRKAVSVEVSQIELVVTMEMVLIGYRACAEWSKPISQGNWCRKFQKRPLPWVGLVVEKLCSLNSNCFVSLLKLWENWVSTECFHLFICQLG